MFTMQLILPCCPCHHHHHHMQEIWNTRSNLNALPYHYSKTVAERRAWEMAEKATHW
jgi:dihydroflavonol-4-reductase